MILLQYFLVVFLLYSGKDNEDHFKKLTEEIRSRKLAKKIKNNTENDGEVESNSHCENSNRNNFVILDKIKEEGHGGDTIFDKEYVFKIDNTPEKTCGSEDEFVHKEVIEKSKYFVGAGVEKKSIKKEHTTPRTVTEKTKKKGTTKKKTNTSTQKTNTSVDISTFFLRTPTKTQSSSSSKTTFTKSQLTTILTSTSTTTSATTTTTSGTCNITQKSIAYSVPDSESDSTSSDELGSPISVLKNERTVIPESPTLFGNPMDAVTPRSVGGHTMKRRNLNALNESSNPSNEKEESDKEEEDDDAEFSNELSQFVDKAYCIVSVADSDSDVTISNDNEAVPKPPEGDFTFNWDS